MTEEQHVTGPTLQSHIASHTHCSQILIYIVEHFFIIAAKWFSLAYENLYASPVFVVIGSDKDEGKDDVQTGGQLV